MLHVATNHNYQQGQKKIGPEWRSLKKLLGLIGSAGVSREIAPECGRMIGASSTVFVESFIRDAQKT
jgi:hypothetical protein